MNAVIALVAQLKGTAAVNNIIAGRVWPSRAPQVSDTFPRVLIAVEESATDSTYAGPTGLASAKLKISCQALVYDNAAILSDAVRTAIDGQKGTWGGVAVTGAFYEGQNDEEYEHPDDGDVGSIYAAELSVLIWFGT